MQITHIALYTPDLERLREFYETYFGAEAGPRYHNPVTRFSSYFLSFPGGPRLELMQRPDVPVLPGKAGDEFTGYTHIALGLGSRAAVDTLTARLARAGYPVVQSPRLTGDGYYESVILDPDGNRIELTV